MENKMSPLALIEMLSDRIDKADIEISLKLEIMMIINLLIKEI